MRKVRMLIDVSGTHLGDNRGTKRGQTIEMPDSIAEQYIANGIATSKLEGELPRAYQGAS